MDEKMRDKIEAILSDMEVYTSGRLDSARVYLTVEELQDYIDKIRNVMEGEK